MLILGAYKKTGYLFFRNPPLPKISTLSLRQKGCAYYGKCAYYGCAYYKRGQYFFFFSVSIVIESQMRTTLMIS